MVIEAAVRDAVRLLFWKDGSGGFAREFYGSTVVMVRGCLYKAAFYARGAG